MNLTSTLFRREFRQRTFRFIVVGVGCTLLYFFLAILLSSASFSISLAHGVAFFVSLGASYLGQKKFTFQISGEHSRAGPRFIIATAAIAGIQYLLILALAHVGAREFFIFLASAIFYPAASFLVHNFYTFKQSRDLNS